MYMEPNYTVIMSQPKRGVVLGVGKVVWRLWAHSWTITAAIKPANLWLLGESTRRKCSEVQRHLSLFFYTRQKALFTKRSRTINRLVTKWKSGCIATGRKESPRSGYISNKGTILLVTSTAIVHGHVTLLFRRTAKSQAPRPREVKSTPIWPGKNVKNRE